MVDFLDYLEGGELADFPLVDEPATFGVDEFELGGLRPRCIPLCSSSPHASSDRANQGGDDRKDN